MRYITGRTKDIIISISIGVVLVGLVVTFAIIASADSYNNISMSKDMQYPRIYSKGIKVIHSGGNEEIVDTPYKIDTEDVFSVVLDISGYKDYSDLTIDISSSYLGVVLYLDEKRFYGYKTDKSNLVKSGATILHLVDIPTVEKANTVRIEFTPLLKRSIPYRISPIRIGTRGSIIHEHIQDDVPRLSLCLMLLTVFIIMIIICISIYVKGIPQNSAFLTGLICYALSLYLALNTWTVHYFVNSNILIYFLEFSVFASLTMPMVLLAKRTITTKFVWLLNLSLICSTLNVVVQNILTICEVLEFRQMLIASHICSAFGIISIMIAFLTAKYADHARKKDITVVLVLLSAVFIIGMILYNINNNMNYIELVIVAILIFIIIHMYMLAKEYINTYMDKMGSIVYKQMALLDDLCGAGSRVAYNEKVEWLESNSDSYESLLVVALDMNRLKEVNDAYGHSEGDRLLVALTRIVTEVSSDYGESYVYRVGGDEFVIIIINMELERLGDYVMTMRKRAEQYHSEVSGNSLSIAIGHHIILSKDDVDISNAVDMADKKMYEDKKRWRERSQLPERRIIR